MDLVIKLSLVAICLFMAWRTVKMIQANPGLFSKASLGKSFMTVGMLALILIAFISLMVLSIRKG